MCGRFVSSSPPDEIARYFGAEPPSSSSAPHQPSYNVAPSTDIYAVYEDGTTRRLDSFRWGLVPGWAKDLSVGNRMVNARADRIPTSNAFRRAFVRRRCIVPADGFYEWTAVPGRRRKQPYYLHRSDGELLAFAGLWEIWRGPRRPRPDGDDVPPPVRSCTIITTQANEAVAALHDRMPVILPASDWDAWLDPGNDDTEALGRLLVPAPAGLLAMRPVSDEVGNVRNDGRHLIEPVPEAAPQARQPTLSDAVE